MNYLNIVKKSNYEPDFIIIKTKMPVIHKGKRYLISEIT